MCDNEVPIKTFNARPMSFELVKHSQRKVCLTCGKLI